MSKKTLTVIVTMLVVGTAFTAFLVNGHSVSAFPSYQQDCSNCHGSAGVYTNTVTAVPSAATVAPGASYNVSITMKSASGTGYWIANSDASGTTGSSTGVYAGGTGQGTNGQWTATIIAPTAQGTYYYKVFGQSGPSGPFGSVGFKTLQIVVAAANTPTATLVPPINTPVPPTETIVPPTITRVPPTSMSTSVAPSRSGTGAGQQLFNRFCASCHTPGSPRYAGNTAGESASDITDIT